MTHVLSAVAWPYANGPRHIGHVAGFGVPSDVFSRYMRMAGHQVLMVSGTDEHGTPILVTADKEGVSAKDLADRNNAVIVKDLADLGLSYDLFTRTTTGNHYGVVQEMFRDRAGQRLHGRADHPGRHQPVDGPHPARPLHRGHLPDLRVRRRARRPVRQLRQPARRHRPDRPPRRRSTGRRRTSSTPSTSCSTCPRSPSALGAWLDEREASGTWRPNVIKFSQNILKEIRPRAMTRDIDWGIPVPGLGGPADQAALRLVRRGHRLPLGLDRVGPPPGRAGQVARLVERPARPCPTTSWARTTSSSTPRSGPPSCSPTTARARAAASRARTACSTCRPRSSPPSTSRWATSSSPPRAATSSTSATSWSATAPTRCATSSARPGPRRPTRPSRGPTSSPATTPSWSPAGATWSTGRPR